MHKYLTGLLALAMLFCLAACQNAPAGPETTQPTPPPGLNTTPSGFVGFDDSTKPVTDPTEATADTTEPVTEPTEEATEPTEGTTQPEEVPTDPGKVSISPDAEGFIRYTNLSNQAKYEFFKEFGGDPVAFDNWLDTAEAAFREKYPEHVYDGGPIILPEAG